MLGSNLRKGQVTIFIIFGVLIVGVVVLTAVLMGQDGEVLAPSDLGPRDFVVACVKDVVEDSVQKMMDNEASGAERSRAEKQFRLDIKKHIKDIADKYIIENETDDGAIMFIPAEAVFAEIHAHQPQLVEEAQRARGWMVSPTTLMAVLTTARAVLKDSATRKQVHVIQEHLVSLAKDFDRFKMRMDNLSKHIKQANRDVEDVHISASKISSRFEKIEKVELKEEDVELLESDSNSQ